LALSSLDDVKVIALQVNAARKDFIERYKGYAPQERVEAMLVDIFGLLYTEFYVRKRE
jgi:hypothetical protein